MSRKKETRFARWFRTIPLTILALTLVFSVCVSHLPASLMRAWFYPVYYADVIEDAARTYHLDPYLVCGIIKCESDWDATATSSAGAKGLMQIMPETAAYLFSAGFVKEADVFPDNLYDPETNIYFGCCYLARLITQTDSLDEAIAAYNAGPGTVAAWTEAAKDTDFLDSIRYPETRLYIKRVQEARAFYKTYYPDGVE